MTLLLITHEPPLAARCTDQVLMADGRLHQPVVAAGRATRGIRRRRRMSELALAWRFARRELRAGLQGLVVFLACLSPGVAAIATVGVINSGVVDAVQRDAATLLGGDIRLETSIGQLPRTNSPD